jgi:hypothetical protein
MSASIADGLRSRCNPLGAERFKRQAATMRATPLADTRARRCSTPAGPVKTSAFNRSPTKVVEMDAIKPIPDLPRGLRDAALRSTLIPFVGAGASRIAGCPDWAEFAEGVKSLPSVAPPRTERISLNI